MKRFSVNRFSLYLCLAGIGIILLAVLWCVVEYQTFTKTALAVKGTVEGFVERKTRQRVSGSNRSRESISYAPVVRYTTRNGESYRFISSASSWLSVYDKGERVDVLYDPANPGRAEINDSFSLYLGQALVAGTGLVFVLLGSGIMAVPKLKGRKNKRLKEAGQAVATTFKEVKQNTNLTIGGRRPYNVITTWVDPSTNETYTFSSDNIWFNPKDQIVQDKITVYMEPGNPKKYYVDVSFLKTN